MCQAKCNLGDGKQNRHAFISHVAFFLMRQTDINQVITQVNIFFKIEKKF